jgi:hypothetical protein
VLTIILPVHAKYDPQKSESGKSGENSILEQEKTSTLMSKGRKSGWDADSYLWIYVVFAYLFTAAALYLIVTETNHVIRVRQKYLSTHSTVKDRTIRLSGIPVHLRSEQAIKDTIENLQIGKVESVTLCKKWHELDALIDRRMIVLRKLEEAWTVYLGPRRRERALEDVRMASIRHQEEVQDDEDQHLIQPNGNGEAHHTSPADVRPTTRIWYGGWRMRSKKIDAIDYYEEQLRRLDEQIKDARKKEYEPASLAFVTLDSIAACVSSS